MLKALIKHKYNNSKHFLLAYYNLKHDVLNCNLVNENDFEFFYTPIKSFDNLIDIKKFITNDIFLYLSFNSNIYCIQQLRVLVGIDSNNIKYSINRYPQIEQKLEINNTAKGYYYYFENMMFLEEFMSNEDIDNLNKKIKIYNIKRNLEL